jgi:hypothetical protein
VLEALRPCPALMLGVRWSSFGNSHSKQNMPWKQRNLAQMLTMQVHDCLRCQQGNGWKLQTFYNTMHRVSDMCKYGKPKEANIELGEKCIKLKFKDANYS